MTSPPSIDDARRRMLRSVEAAGEPVIRSANQPFALDDPEVFFTAVLEGGSARFAVDLPAPPGRERAPHGRRRELFRVAAGEVAWFIPDGGKRSTLAVALPGTRLVRIARTEFERLVSGARPSMRGCAR
jgi:hypothetical protein